MVPASAKLAYEAGSNVLTVISVRSLFMVTIIGAILLLRGESLRISSVAFRYCILAGVSYSLMSYGFLGSIEFIPVSLMVLIYFLHPPLLALYAHISGEERLTIQRATGMFIVVIGLAFAMSVEFSDLDIRGVLLAVLAAVSVCVMILANAKAQKTESSFKVNFHMGLVTTIILLTATAAFSNFSFPSNLTGWGGIAGASVGLTLGFLAFFGSFQFIGAVRATLISSIEPLTTTIFAVILIGESLSLTEWFGASLVITGIVIIEWRKS